MPLCEPVTYRCSKQNSKQPPPLEPAAHFCENVPRAADLPSFGGNHLPLGHPQASGQANGQKQCPAESRCSESHCMRVSSQNGHNWCSHSRPHSTNRVPTLLPRVQGAALPAGFGPEARQVRTESGRVRGEAPAGQGRALPVFRSCLCLWAAGPCKESRGACAFGRSGQSPGVGTGRQMGETGDRHKGQGCSCPLVYPPPFPAVLSFRLLVVGHRDPVGGWW